MSRQCGSMAGRPAKVARDAVEDAPGGGAITNSARDHGMGTGANVAGGQMQQVKHIVLFISLNADECSFSWN